MERVRGERPWMTESRRDGETTEERRVSKDSEIEEMFI